MKATLIPEMKKLKEKYFKLRADSDQVYIVNHFNRSESTYSISPVDDMNAEKFISKNRLVFIGFTY